MLGPSLRMKKKWEYLPWEPGAPCSWVKHSTTEPLRSQCYRIGALAPFMLILFWYRISGCNYIEFGTVVQVEISIFSFAGHLIQSGGGSLWNFETSLSLPVLFIMTFPRWNFIFVFVFDILSSLWSPDEKWWSLASPMCDVFLSFIIFPFDVLDQVWYLIVLTPDLFLLPNFGRGHY